MNRKGFLASLLVIAGVALAMRLPDLAHRPMHCDEAVHTAKAGLLIESGRYEYDPADYHGPTLYYFAVPVVWLSGADTLAETSEFTFRIVPVLFGVALALLAGVVADGASKSAALVAAALTAVSPGMVFYSRYYIQEMLLVFFTFATIAAGWRYAKTKTWRWAMVLGLMLGLAYATKETCVIAWAAMLASLFAVMFWLRRCDPETARPAGRVRWIPLIVATAVAVLVAALCLSTFFSNIEALANSVRAYGAYLDRANGVGTHDHPWHYYLKLLLYTKDGPGPWWSEAFIVLLAAVGILSVFLNKTVAGERPLLRFLACYTLLTTILYSLIPYKTPWCVLSPLHGMILMAGVGFATLLGRFRAAWLRIPLAAALGFGVLHLGCQAYRASFVFPADPRNPYVYAHPSPDVVRLAERVNELSRIHPDGGDMLVKVVAEEYWPLPWYFRSLKRVGYWNAVPADPVAPVVIAAAELRPELEAVLDDAYQTEYYGLRPGRLLALYIDRGLWEAYTKRRAHSP